MVKVVLVASDNLAEELKGTAEMIVGKSEDVLTLDPCHGSIYQLLKDYDKSNVELLFLCDELDNELRRELDKLEDWNFRLVTGMNLPMLLEVVSLSRSASLDELGHKAKEAGINGIIDTAKRIRQHVSKAL